MPWPLFSWYFVSSTNHEDTVQFSPVSCYVSLLPKISSSGPFSRTSANVLSSVWEMKVSHLCTTRGRLFVLIFMFVDKRQVDKRFLTEWWQAFPHLIALGFFMHGVLICWCPVKMHDLCHTVRGCSLHIDIVICPAVCSWDMMIYLVFWAHTFRPASLLVTDKVFFFLYYVRFFTR